MIRAKTNIDSREVVSTDTLPTLFVEGGGGDRFDASVMKMLFDGAIRVESLGPSDGVRFAADAFKRSHHHYFFLIDRDTLGDKAVEKSWKTFDQPNGSNLLIWRKREIENYFLSPAFLSMSQFCSPNTNKKKISDKIVSFAQKRLYVDALNFVIISCRETLRQTGIQIEKLDNIQTENDARTTIARIKNFGTYITKARDLSEKMETMFSERLELLRGDSDVLQVGKGKWQDQMEGKEILRSVLSQGLFKVESTNKKVVEGIDKFNRIIEDLLKLENQKSDDFPRELLDIKIKVWKKIRLQN
jgi:hypothetical protein